VGVAVVIVVIVVVVAADVVSCAAQPSKWIKYTLFEWIGEVLNLKPWRSVRSHSPINEPGSPVELFQLP
jgi:hypothetical protein